MGKRLHGERGASAVEFALVLVPLLAILFGIIQYGFVFARAQGVEGAARQAARLAAVGADNGEVCDRAVSAPPVGASAGELRVSVNGDRCEDLDRSAAICPDATDVTVVVEADSSPVTLPFVPMPGEVSGDAVFRCES